MAHLTDEQAQALIDNNPVYKREINGVFDCFHFSGSLDGANYYASEKDTGVLPADSDKPTVDSHFKSLLMSQEHKESKNITDKEV